MIRPIVFAATALGLSLLGWNTTLLGWNTTPGVGSQVLETGLTTARHAAATHPRREDAAEPAAEPPRGLDDRLEQLFAEAGQDLKPLDESRLESARQAAMDAAWELESRLQQGTEDHVAAWKSYLLWDELMEQLNGESPQVTVLRRVHERLRRNHPGLELAGFTQLRDAILDYTNLASFSGIKDFPTYTRSVLSELRKQLETYATDPSVDTAHRIGRLLGLLEITGQAPTLVAEVRSRFAHPNLVAYVSEDFLDASLGREVDDRSPVQEVILGTYQTGTAHTTGRVRFRLQAHPEEAHLISELEGTTISQNVGRRSIGSRNSITIHSTGTTQVSAEKKLFVALDGIRTTPARVCCRTSTCIHCIQSPPLLSGIVSSQVYAKKGQAEQIASQRAARRIGRRFDEQVREAIQNNQGGGASQARAVLTRLDSRPWKTHLRTSQDALHFRAWQRDPLQLAAATPPPARQVPHDFGLTIHESAVNNLLESVFAGKTLTRQRLVQLVGQRTDEGAAELESQLGDEDWSIRFPSTQPIVVQFSSEGIRFRITGNRFTREDQVLTDPMFISGMYRPIETAEGIVFRRQGDLEVDYVAGGSRSARQIAFRSFARDKFNLLFEEELAGQGFRLPEKFGLQEEVRLRDLMLSASWLELGWSRQSNRLQTARQPVLSRAQ